MTNVVVPVFHDSVRVWATPCLAALIILCVVLFALATIQGTWPTLVASIAVSAVMVAVVITSAVQTSHLKDEYRAEVAQAFSEQVGARVLDGRADDASTAKAPLAWGAKQVPMVLSVHGLPQSCLVEVKTKTHTTVGLLVSCTDSHTLAPLKARR